MSELHSYMHVYMQYMYMYTIIDSEVKKVKPTESSWYMTVYMYMQESN